MRKKLTADEAREINRVRCAEWREKNRARHNQFSREHYRKNRTEIIEKLKQKRTENPDFFKKRSRDEYLKNREKILEQNRQWRSKNKARLVVMERNRRENKVAKLLFYGARARARKAGIPFSITLQDIVVPERCPALGIPLVMARGTAGAASPTLDRIIPDLGYIRGNVAVISQKANTMKSNASAEELFRLARWVQEVRGIWNTETTSYTVTEKEP